MRKKNRFQHNDNELFDGISQEARELNERLYWTPGGEVSQDTAELLVWLKRMTDLTRDMHDLAETMTGQPIGNKPAIYEHEKYTGD